MTPDIRRASAIIFGGALVAASVIGVAIGMASLADENLQECGVMSCVDHSTNGATKDQPGLIGRSTPTATPVIVSATAAPMPTEIAEPDDFGDEYGEAITEPPATEPPAPTCAEGTIMAEDGSCVGADFYDVIEAPRPADGERATGAVIDYDTGTLFCGVGAAPAIDQDPFGNWWAYCEPALID